MIWFRSANSHTGPQLHRCTIRGRTDGSIRLRADLLQKPLASRGASTDEYTPPLAKRLFLERVAVCFIFFAHGIAFAAAGGVRVAISACLAFLCSIGR